nr:hypothetical protein [Klebsiella pneumoniae subsp. pneumoniae]
MPAAPPLARHTDQAEALLNGVRTFCALVAIGAWGSVPSGPAARRP